MNSIKRSLTTAGLGACLIAPAAFAQTTWEDTEISANVAYATNYVFRGVSQTDNQRALQGGFDWSHDSGFYIGTWASNVDSSFFAGPTDPQLEVDYYAGYANEVGEIGYDVGVLYYTYPGADDFDTWEFLVGLSYSYFGATLYYSDELNFIGVEESAYYLDLSAEFPLGNEFALAAHVGYNAGDAYDEAGDGIGVDSYIDWAIGISRPLLGVDLALTYVSSDDDGQDLFGEEIADEELVFIVSKSF